MTQSIVLPHPYPLQPSLYAMLKGKAQLPKNTDSYFLILGGAVSMFKSKLKRNKKRDVTPSQMNTEHGNTDCEFLIPGL